MVVYPCRLSAPMDQLFDLDPTEAVKKVSGLLGCSPTSEKVAEYFDENDKLRHLRANFLVPKIADLPPCE